MSSCDMAVRPLERREKKRERRRTGERTFYFSAERRERTSFYMRVWSDEKRNMIPPRITFRDFPPSDHTTTFILPQKRAEMEEL